MEFLALGLFTAALILCVALDISILYALGVGLVIFLIYGLRRGFSLKALLGMSLAGVKKTRNILITFFLIGVLTALWRASGTIPVIVCYAASAVRPSVFLLTAFLLNCLVSVLTGTAFGTAATMGVICAAMGTAMGVPMLYTGGAVLSGVFFGDRCSPVSTSALLVAELTGTSIFDNIKQMVKTAAAPFLLSCAAYLLMGFFVDGGGAAGDLTAVFGAEFRLHWTALLPAALIMGLSAARVNVKLSMAAGIAASLIVCFALQGCSALQCLQYAALGYEADTAEAAALINGGGVVSILRVAVIVCLSSAYSGIFQGTGMLDGMRRGILALARRTTPFAAVLCTASAAALVACNQTLAIMLTHQLCGDVEPDAARLAADLEDTAVLVSPMVPWSIACAMPLATIGASPASVLTACFLYSLPLLRLAGSFIRKRRARGPEQKNAAG